MWCHSDHKNLSLRWAIDDTERKALDQNAAGFLVGRRSAKRMVSRTDYGSLNCGLKPKAGACTGFGVVRNFLEQFNLCRREEANFDHFAIRRALAKTASASMAVTSPPSYSARRFSISASQAAFNSVAAGSLSDSSS